MEIDIPEVLAELTAAFQRYEAALVGNDVAVLDALFWPSDKTLRYGVGENLRSFGEIAAFRAARSPAGLARRLINTRITTFGRDFGVANTEFERAGQPAPGRQSQSWVRFPDGWRIVAAHVSLIKPG